MHIFDNLIVEPPNRQGDYGYAFYCDIIPQGGATPEQTATLFLRKYIGTYFFVSYYTLKLLVRRTHR
jgi:hypothetical protein